MLNSFPLTQDQCDLRDSIRRFAREEVAPGYLERAKSESFDWNCHRRIAEMGLLEMLVEEEPDYIALGIVVEELAAADFNVANAVIPVSLMALIISRFGTPRTKREVLEPLTLGEAYVALGLTEPETGSDVGAITTRATATDDGYVISGEKTSVTMLGESKWIMLAVQTDRDGQDAGPSMFIVELDSPGVQCSPVSDTGWRPLGRGVLYLDNVAVPHDALVGTEGSAFRTVLAGFDFTRPLLALTGIACALTSIADTADYVRTRTAFGRPLAQYEGVSFQLAEHSTRLEAARLLCYSTLWQRNSALPHTAMAAMGKWYGPRVASDAIHDCLLLHGNYGYSTEFPFEQRMRDSLAVEIADGTAQIQKIIIARELFGREFLPYEKL